MRNRYPAETCETNRLVSSIHTLGARPSQQGQHIDAYLWRRPFKQRIRIKDTKGTRLTYPRSAFQTFARREQYLVLSLRGLTSRIPCRKTRRLKAWVSPPLEHSFSRRCSIVNGVMVRIGHACFSSQTRHDEASLLSVW